jgi:hypothetical protein
MSIELPIMPTWSKVFIGVIPICTPIVEAQRKAHEEGMFFAGHKFYAMVSQKDE